MNRALTDRVGMAVFAASWSMLLVSLCFAAIALRRIGAWHSPVAALGGWLAAFSCVLVVACSVALWRRHERLAFILGAGFVAAQVLVLVRASRLESLRTEQLVWLLTGFHAVHVAVGVAGVVARLLVGKEAGMWRAYWHLLTGAWLIISAVLFW